MKETREKLLQTATELFAKRGIDGVSTRDLAKVSGVNLCSINYYFGSKQNLYDAVLECVIEKISNFASSKQIPLQTQNLTPIEEFDAFASNMVDFLCSDKISGAGAELLIKEIIRPTNVYNKLYQTVIEPIHKRMTAIVMKITGLDEHNAIIQTHCLMGQVVMFKVHKSALLRRLDVKDYSPELIKEIKSRIIENCHILLKGVTK